MDNKALTAIVKIPPDEDKKLGLLIKSFRKKHIRPCQQIVDLIFTNNPNLLKQIHDRKISSTIFELRDLVYSEFLLDEANFNIVLMEELQATIDTPKSILDLLLVDGIAELNQDQLFKKIRSICGEYSGRIFPYIYQIALSNTNSRRSRAGQEFEAIIYKIYESLGYEYDSQKKVGRKIFTELGLGKKVDSILPNYKSFSKRRNKTIIGTMKTTLRERWQQVAEEIERTKIPEIHLLTVDQQIPSSKASEMNKHNIVVVAYDFVANSESLSSMKNIISFEDYMFKEIPGILKYWQIENE